MWLRLTAILICIVFFINGCNSLISQFFGTHKLRVFSIEEALNKGIGDADYVRLDGAWKPGDYIVIPPKNAADKAVLLFPLLSKAQMAELDAGNVVQPKIIAWTKNFSMNCDEQNNCAPRLQVDAVGVVRKMQQDKNKAHLLPTASYQLPDNASYIEIDRHPIAWYWNLLMLVGGIGIAIYIEGRAQKQRIREREQQAGEL